MQLKNNHSQFFIIAVYRSSHLFTKNYGVEQLKQTFFVKDKYCTVKEDKLLAMKKQNIQLSA
jgi:hypothetical protein